MARVRGADDRERFHELRIPVRFHEVDSYGVVWHGHYVAWLEAGRNALAAAFGMDIVDLSRRGYLLPVVSLQLDYRRPAVLGDEIIVETRLQEPRGAWFTFDGRVRQAGEGVLLATASVRLVILNAERELLVTLPALLRDAAEGIRKFHRGEG